MDINGEKISLYSTLHTTELYLKGIMRIDIGLLSNTAILQIIEEKMEQAVRRG